MQNRIAVLATASLLVAGLAACSSEPKANHPSQASVTINQTTVTGKQVTCDKLANQLPGQDPQWYWTVNIGDQKVAGAKVSLNGSGENLVANSVRIQNLGGFTGMYSRGDGGEATVSFASEVLTITGKALGFNTSVPEEPAEATFKIVATC